MPNMILHISPGVLVLAWALPGVIPPPPPFPLFTSHFPTAHPPQTKQIIAFSGSVNKGALVCYQELHSVSLLHCCRADAHQVHSETSFFLLSASISW